jgi:hypothetical protein
MKTSLWDSSKSLRVWKEDFLFIYRQNSTSRYLDLTLAYPRLKPAQALDWVFYAVCLLSGEAQHILI